MAAARISLLVAGALVLAFLIATGRPLTGQLDNATSVEHASASSNLRQPVLNQNFPDPGILEAGGVFYAFATNSGRQNIPTARSTDLVDWTMLPDAMPVLAPWVQPFRSMVWAPETIRVGDEYRMYYTAHDDTSKRQCIGVASSASPEGPYRDTSAAPLICPDGYQRAIDASPFFDGKQLYLYFSGVCCSEPNGLYAQKLTPDGLSTVGSPTLLLRVDAPWEGEIAEAPTMLRHGGKLYLFYSGNDYRNQTYAVGYATCRSAAGPCSKAKENPLLATGYSGSDAIGPGHQTIARVGSDYWLLFHGWNGAVGYNRGGSRVMWLQPLLWKNGKPQLSNAAR
ncbi:MAG: glycoside hydrolase family 43 protein [Dehalococcoidia bacterium]